MAERFRFQEVCAALVRTVAYFDVIDYAPLWSELCSWVEWGGVSGFERMAPPDAFELLSARDALARERRIECDFGRVAFPGRLAVLAALSMERTALFARKVRRARRVARRLARLPGVRFAALVNTTALEHARDRADLDFFVIVRHGRLWMSRLLCAAPYRLAGKLSSPGAKPDAICFSYFVTDADLNLGAHMLPGDDPYFRYWFLSLLPLYDDGASEELWNANIAITARHPRAMRWIAPPDFAVRRPLFRFPDARVFESAARRMQTAWFPARIRDRMNLDTTVMVSDRVLKFHVDDARERFRAAYDERLRALGL
jgi:hypothetical protein